MRVHQVHMLKCHPEPFAAAWRGDKAYEIRDVSDRTFRVGDVVVLHEFDPELGVYVGRQLAVQVTYLSGPGTWGLPRNICVMGTRPLERKGEDPNGGFWSAVWNWLTQSFARP